MNTLRKYEAKLKTILLQYMKDFKAETHWKQNKPRRKKKRTKNQIERRNGTAFQSADFTSSCIFNFLTFVCFLPGTSNWLKCFMNSFRYESWGYLLNFFTS